MDYRSFERQASASDAKHQAVGKLTSTTDIRSCEIDGKEAVFVLWDVENFFGIGGSCILPVLRHEFSAYHRGYSFALLRDDGYEFLESYGDEFDGLLSIQKEIVRTICCEGDV